jgi:hypothetical protein
MAVKQPFPAGKMQVQKIDGHGGGQSGSVLFLPVTGWAPDDFSHHAAQPVKLVAQSRKNGK